MQETFKMSLAVQACAAPAAVNSPIGAVVVLPAPVCLQENTVLEFVVTSTHVQYHPCDAVGSPIVPVVAVPPVPTLIVNAAVPLLFGIEGLVPKPAEMVGAVPVIRGAVKLAGKRFPVIKRLRNAVAPIDPPSEPLLSYPRSTLACNGMTVPALPELFAPHAIAIVFIVLSLIPIRPEQQ